MRAVWFDDQIDDPLGVFLSDAVMAEGMTLTALPVNDSESMLSAIGRSVGYASDIAIVDMRLGQTDDRVTGTELLQRLSAYWRGPVVILTRYPKDEEVRRWVDPRLRLIEVVKPDSVDVDELRRWFSGEFWPQMVRHIGDTPPAGPVDAAQVAGAREYLGAQLSEIESWTFEGRIAAKSRAAGPLIEDLETCFADASLSYLLVTAWPPRVVRAGRDEDEVPGVEFLREEQRAHNAPAILVRRPAAVNLFGTAGVSPCSPSAGPAQGSSRHSDWFPTLHVEIMDKEFEIHLDTGSDYTFLGYRLIGNVAPARDEDEYWAPMRLQVGIGPSRNVMVSEWKVSLRARSRTGHLERRVPVQLLLDFDDSGLAAVCRQHCSGFPVAADPGTRVACRYRPGLIGRDVFRETGWSLVVDTARQRSFVLKHDDPLVAERRSPKRGRWFG